jgi:hypothetical protein
MNRLICIGDAGARKESLWKRCYSSGVGIFLILIFTLGLNGCSVRKFAVNKLGDSLANSGTTFASDNDPEFVGQAVPFSLKLIEGLLAESPKHRGLLFAATSGFTQYSYVYVQQPSDEIENADVEKSAALRARARNLYLRARDYGLRGLEAKHRGFTVALQENPKSAVGAAKVADVPLLYWTAVSWGAALSLSKDHPAIVVEVPLLVPLGAAFGIDPVRLGIIFLANMELGYLTPPVGLNLLMSSYRFRKPVPEVLRAVLPVIVVLSIGVLLITYIPALTTALPQLLGR